ncbi:MULTISPECIES: amidophosphoribosyltransferase [Marinobacterium]|jgi:amidophosphoribosyltransferase|uniref:Amidophosphoribosyltransferase n=1 Tax=Marinobacterium iners DSM 11526 TaxID=1122198 RepID=A0A1H3ZJS5_9GAMM|nr:amidophosphoribosyltransferase [Marinobacterium iners]QSR35391.1 amidophosphoribosyltransferase [Marinobacterium iners]SEA23868.1 amidophosphoribosyltransferase [Marinobacterium iners DSM 11526]
MCGIVGVVAKSFVNQTIFDALTVLQHRGQDAAGMVTCEGDRFFLRKDNGLVNEVFRTRHMKKLNGNMGIGHVRYPTAGSNSSAEAQPFYVNSPYGIALAHNGNLTNADKLADEIFRSDLRHINTTSDSEVLLNIFAHELQQIGKLQPTADDIFNAVEKVHARCQGGYAVVAMITGYGIVAFRDPCGIRPLVYGQRVTDKGEEYMVASESVALDTSGYTLVRDLAPGEAIFIDTQGQVSTRQCAQVSRVAPCLFEFVYLARPDSIIDGVSVHHSRMEMGVKLAEKVMRERPDHDIDVVIPIPDTSRTAALEMANTLGVKFREGFIKNRYIGRTFIMPGQTLRKKSVRQKLNPIMAEFRDKVVMLVDDSIVRGTTSKQIVQMARDAGARKVYFASAAPEVRFPNVYGIDMPSASELIAHGRTADEVGEYIGCDWMLYQDLDDLKKSVTCFNPEITEFDTCVFDGRYVTGTVDEDYLARVDAKRNDGAMSASDPSVEDSNESADLHSKID